MTMIVALTKEECHCSIFDFYDNVAANVGYFPTRNTRYDCQKICCSPEVQDEIFAHYRESDCNDATIGCLWMNLGPKANLVPEKKLGKYVVTVETGAIYEEGEKKHD